MYHLAESVVHALGKTVRLCEQPEELQRVGFTTVRCLTCLWLSILLYFVVCILVRKLAGRCAFAKEVQGVAKSVTHLATASGARESSVWDRATTQHLRRSPKAARYIRYILMPQRAIKTALVRKPKATYFITI